MADEEWSLVLDSESLQSKYGFHDGDRPDSLVEWLEAHGTPEDLAAVLACDWHAVLGDLVLTHLVPRVAEHHEIEACLMVTSHNPVRAYQIDGEGVDYRGIPRDLEPEEVIVSLALVLASCREHPEPDHDPDEE